jgi:small conductance mechanosensitive channel
MTHVARLVVKWCTGEHFLNIDFGKAWKQTQLLINEVIASLPNLLLALIVFLVFFLISRYAAKLVRALVVRVHQAPGVGMLLGRLAQSVIVILGILVAISVVFPSFKASDLIQVLGIGGVAIGFAFKDIFQNFFAGILILISRPFRIGDQVAVGNMEGVVEDIQTRATMIRTYDNRRIVVPNINMYAQEVTVLTAYSKRRIEYDLPVGFEADTEEVKALILEVLKNNKHVENEPEPDVLTISINEATTTLRARWWIKSSGTNNIAVKDEILSALKEELVARKIEVAVPTQVIKVDEEEKQPFGRPFIEEREEAS